MTGCFCKSGRHKQSLIVEFKETQWPEHKENAKTAQGKIVENKMTFDAARALSREEIGN